MYKGDEMRYLGFFGFLVAIWMLTAGDTGKKEKTLKQTLGKVPYLFCNQEAYFH